MNVKVAKIIRKELKNVYPNERFSVTSNKGMGYTSIDITPKQNTRKRSEIRNSLKHLISKCGIADDFSQVIYKGENIGTVYIYIN